MRRTGDSEGYTISPYLKAEHNVSVHANLAESGSLGKRKNLAPRDLYMQSQPATLTLTSIRLRYRAAWDLGATTRERVHRHIRHACTHARTHAPHTRTRTHTHTHTRMHTRTRMHTQLEFTYILPVALNLLSLLRYQLQPGVERPSTA